MPPVGNAMRLIDHKKADTKISDMALNIFAEKCFRCHENKVYFILLYGRQNIFSAILNSAVQDVAPKPHLLRRFHLIFHENQQRAYDQRDTAMLGAHQFCAYKVNQTFAPAGSLHHEGTSFSHSGLNSLVLSITESCLFSV